MTYRPRPGIVMLNICGERILAAERRLWAECPQITILKGPGVMVWKALENGTDLESVIALISMLSQQPKEEVRERVEGFLRKLADKGFLIEDGETGHDES